MAKVFRLFDGADVTHWETRAGDYNNNVIREIKGGDGDKTQVLPTSIPSPFARLDLFRSAFSALENPTIALDGDTNNHRIVSECLDLLELLYNYDSVSDRLRIVSWDKTIDLPLLQDSSEKSHQLLGRTLSLFLNQDSRSFHFNALNRFYIIYFDGFILGGTSPKTLVFTSANAKKFAEITFERDTLFSGTINPLYNRDRGFVKYMVSLFNENPVLQERMSEFNAYIQRNVDQLRSSDHSFYQELDRADVRTLADYAELETQNASIIEVFGIALRKIKRRNQLDNIQAESEFLIDSDKKFDGFAPMVLAKNGNLGHLNYLNATTKWDVNQQVDDSKLPPNQRTLPGKNIQYPYLTIGDFLTDEIYETPYPLNSDFFFDGNLSNKADDSKVGYLLPLRPLFFECFQESFLWTKKFGDKPMIQIVKKQSFVEVTLCIPINSGKNHIELSKKYEKSGIKETNGKIVSCKKYLQLFPFQQSTVEPNYYINLLDAEENDNNQELILTFDGKPASHKSLKSRLYKADSYQNTHFYRVKENFRWIELQQYGSADSNYLIPKWSDDKGIDSQFTFSIDFGTSNTHVEYAVNAGQTKPLDFRAQRNGIAKTYSLQNIEGEERLLLEMEFIPEEIGGESEFKFPVRTVLFDYHNYDATSYQAFLDYNIGFSYEKRRMITTNKSRAFTNLKWINDAVNGAEQEAQVNSFLEQLIVMCKTKVMIEGGDISATRFVWTYPLSYGAQQIANLSETLKSLITRHFGKNVSIENICESIAPFYAITKEGKLLGTSNHILSLDIGGGTIDSVVYQNKRVKTISSMLFGANFLYANGYETAIEGNGFYQLGENFLNDLPTEILSNIRQIKNSIKDSNRLEDLISFYFSLENHKELKGKTNVSFSKMLAGNRAIRPVLLFYYASIIYYNVRAMKVSGLEKPTKLIFSGNGSRFLSMLDRLEKKEILSEYTNTLIDVVYDDSSGEQSDIQIITYENPKELTSRGAISIVNETEEILKELSVRNIRKSFVTYLGDANNTLLSADKPLRYTELENGFNSAVYKEYETFARLFMDMKGINLKDLFDINENMKSTFESILLHKNRAMEFLETGIELRKRQMKGIDDISDPFFFYIVRGMLSDMLKKIMPNEN